VVRERRPARSKNGRSGAPVESRRLQIIILVGAAGRSLARLLAAAIDAV
jgi:hypothetical protein